jgi:hypothetical protein
MMVPSSPLTSRRRPRSDIQRSATALYERLIEPLQAVGCEQARQPPTHWTSAAPLQEKTLLSTLRLSHDCEDLLQRDLRNSTARDAASSASMLNNTMSMPPPPRLVGAAAGGWG